jgi:hypothetical protein
MMEMIRTVDAELEAGAEVAVEADVDTPSETADEDAAELIALAESVAELAEEVAEVVTATKVHCFVSSNNGCPFCPVTGVRVMVQVSNIGPWGLKSMSMGVKEYSYYGHARLHHILRLHRDRLL